MAGSRDTRRKAHQAITKLGKKAARLYRSLQTAYTERGDHEALEKAEALLQDNQNLTRCREGQVIRFPRRGRAADPGGTRGPVDRGLATSRGWMGRRCPNPITT